MSIKIVALIAVAGLIAVIGLGAMASYVQVPVGYVGLVLQQSQLTDTVLQPGGHFITPFLQTVADVKTAHSKEQMDLSASSHDALDVTTTIAVEYNVNPENARTIYAKYLGEHVSTLIQPQIQGITKSIISNYTVMDLIQKRQQVNDDVEKALKSEFSQYGITITQTSLTDFVPPQSFTDEVTAKENAKQQALKEENLVKVNQAQAQQVVATAEGARDANIAQAEGQAKAIEINADAQAHAITKINDAIKNSPEYLKYKYLDKWDGAVPKVQAGNAVPLLNLDVATK